MKAMDATDAEEPNTSVAEGKSANVTDIDGERKASDRDARMNFAVQSRCDEARGSDPNIPGLGQISPPFLV